MRKVAPAFVRAGDPGLRDEYVKPMFDVTWGPALAVFSMALESANGTLGGSLLTIASDDEIELAAENAAHSIDAYLVGIRTAVCAAGLCDHDPARTSFVRALSNFGGLGTGRLLEARHVRCVRTLLELGRDDAELLGDDWEHVFRCLSEVARLRHVHEAAMAERRAALRAAA